jgi:hypothetical protein
MPKRATQAFINPWFACVKIIASRYRETPPSPRRRPTTPLTRSERGAKSGGGDAEARLRALQGLRPRPRGPLSLPHGARPPGTRAKAGRARQRADLGGFEARRHDVRAQLLTPVLLRPALRCAGAVSLDGPGPLLPQGSPASLRAGGVRRVPARTTRPLPPSTLPTTRQTAVGQAHRVPGARSMGALECGPYLAE